MKSAEFQNYLDNHLSGIKERNQEKYKQFEQLRKSFVKDFPLALIKDLSIDDYVIGKASKDSFCFRIERDLDSLGRIRGSTALKFGIYYGHTVSDLTDKYRFPGRFGINPEEAFQSVKDSIYNLLVNGKNQDWNLLRANKISPMFAGKILATYYPRIYLNIFSFNYLNYFITHLNLDSLSSHTIDLQRSLMEFRNQFKMLRDEHVYLYADFLYYQFGSPKGSVQTEEAEDANRGESDDWTPIPLSKVKGEFISTPPNRPPSKPGKGGKGKRGPIDYDKRGKRARWRGTRGEEVVLKLEQEFLRESGRKDLAKRVKHVANDSPSHDYDIKSFNSKGVEKHIEVKSTSTEDGSRGFYITDRELSFAKRDNNYHIYLVYDVGSPNPKIYQIDKPFKKGKSVFDIKPISYHMNIK